MKKIMENKWLLVSVFLVVILINYLSTLGIILPSTQQEVSDKFANYFAPAGFTFSVWGVIYIGVALILYLEFKHRNNPMFLSAYQKHVKPLMLVWMGLNILWTLLWAYEVLALSYVVIALYGVVLLILARNIKKSSMLSAENLFLVIPVGIHLGWITVASFGNAMTALTQLDITGLNPIGLTFTLIFMVVSLLLVVGSYINTHNIGIIIVAVWSFAGIVMKHAPNSDFIDPSMIIFIAGIVAAVLVAISPILISNRFKR